jgi:hypothetical protein
MSEGFLEFLDTPSARAVIYAGIGGNSDDRWITDYVQMFSDSAEALETLGLAES